MRLISFDIDGTMTFGDPPGHITPAVVRRAMDLGYIVGSCSDRTIGEQKALWERAEIDVHFVSLKHRLDDVKQKFEVTHYLHIGDTDTDLYVAHRAGFDFRWIHQIPEGHDWLHF